MGISSIALFSCLVSDLSLALPTVPFQRLSEPKARDVEWPGIEARAVASLSLLDSILKKFEDGKSKDADSAALAKFLACNSRCESFSAIDVSNIDEITSIALGEFKRSFHDFWFTKGDYWLDPESISSGIATGPGASVGVTGHSFYQKIAAGPMTGTQASLFSLYQREVSKYPLWDEAEKIRQTHFGGFKETKGNRLSFVPKSCEISRTICTEPLLNMLFQKGIGRLFESKLAQRYGINLSTQPDKNRHLAMIGSKAGTYGTIDLSSASDSVSMNLLREICPSYVLSWLDETRSKFTRLPNGEHVPMHMVSSMGNAFTFPLQTILFSSVVVGVYKALNLPLLYPRGESVGNFAVFGDDIIVRREAYNLVVNILERIGFTVNLDKSYNIGPFRESCGLDFWSGYNVRGVYCRTLKTKQDAYSLINRLNVWSSNHAVPLPVTIQFLHKVSGVSYIPIPVWESDVAGLKVPQDLLLPPSTKRDKWTGSIVYKRYVPRNKVTSLLDVGSRPLRSQKGKMLHNPAGILLSAVGGYLRNGEIAYRSSFTSYQKRIAIAPCWDYYDPSHSTLTSEGWHRWKSFYVEMNLGTGSFAG